jgi:hypothetical protein
VIMSAKNGSPKFAMGKQIVATPGALDLLEQCGKTAAEFIQRHVNLEQGDLCDEDHELNSEAVNDGSRILSIFKLGDENLWVISEAADDCGQRVATTLLLPEEY